MSKLAHSATHCRLSANTGVAAVLLVSSSNTVYPAVLLLQRQYLMVLIVGTTLLAWAVSLRLISDTLFAALGVYLHIWATVIFGTLGLLAHVFGLYQPQADMPSQGPLEQCQFHPAQQQKQQERKHQQQQRQHSPLKGHALALSPLEPEHQHTQDLIHSWVESAALHTAHCSPPGSTCPSTTSPPLKEPLSLESSSNGSSATASTGQAVSTAIVKAAAQGMLQAYTLTDTQGKMHAATPAAVAAWATSYVLANRVSESSSPGKGRRVSASVCLPPLEYEASAELQEELEAAAPNEFICPIGRVLMVDPVFTPSGFTYHRPCIMEWIQRTGRDPAQDGSPLSPTQLCPNVNLRDQIATWLQRQGVQT